MHLLDHGVIRRCGDGHLGISPLERLGSDAAEQRFQRLRKSGIGGDLEDLVVLDEGVTLDSLTQAGNPDHMSITTADHPAPVFFAANDRAGAA